MRLENPDKKAIADVCRRYGIRKLSIFGSASRGELKVDSDIDVLVEFEPDRTIGFEIFDIEDELSRIFGGRRVDIVKEKYLNHRLRERILSEAVVQYAEG
jgi:uncharacterized protein